MLISLQKLGKHFGERTILSNVDAIISKQDRIGIIGENGAGKTTLLKIICGEYEPDEGEFYLASGVRLGYLEQNSALDPSLTIYEEMQKAFQPVLRALERMKEIEQLLQNSHSDELLQEHDRLFAFVEAADGYHMDVQIRKILNGMGFPATVWEKLAGVLSGGENTRLRLAKLLAQNPDVLILDEPTNHLDFITMEWLENYLKSYKGAVLVVSHDRYFLDAVCNRIFEVEAQTLAIYKGNYSAYLPQKEAAQTLQQKQHDADVEKAKKLEEYIVRNIERASTSKMAKSRRKQLEKMEITEAPKTWHTDLKFSFEYDLEPYKDLVIAKNISIQIGQRCLVKDLSFIVERGERLVIAGPNGAGKSTLLQVLDGKRRPSAGMVRLGNGAKPGIFEQQQLRRGGTVLSAVWDKWPRMVELEVRSHLAKFGFRGEDVFKSCESLSGGELARLRFAELVLERPNLMFLDEPTNHLDVYTRESLGNALQAYTGTLILVTHDRYLMNSLACPILYIEDAQAKLYASYDALMNRGQKEASAATQAEKPKETKNTYGKEQRRRKAELRNQIKQYERDIEALDEEVATYQEQMNSPEVLQDYKKLEEICQLLEEAKKKQQELTDFWGEAAIEYESMEEE